MEIPPSTTPTVDTKGPLSPEQLGEVGEARQRVRRIAGAVGLARFNFRSFVVIAILSLPFVFFYPTTLVAVACLCWLAAVERRGGRMLKELEPNGGRVLAYNQISLLVLVVAYCGWQIARSHSSATPFDEVLSSNLALTELEETGMLPGGTTGLDDMNRLFRISVTIFYGAVMVLTALLQGGCAWYYYSRYRLLKDFQAQTPPWVREVLKAAS